MNKIIFILITTFVITFQSLTFALSDFESVKYDYEQYGFEVPQTNVMYVNSFGNLNVQGLASDGMIFIKKSDDSLRVLRHEVAHVISEKAIKENPEGFELYKTDRMKHTVIKTTWHNVTGDELNQIIKILRWVYSVTKKEEIVAEDIYWMVYGLQRQQYQILNDPTTEQSEKLLELLSDYYSK